jgi:hypothetical protein
MFPCPTTQGREPYYYRVGVSLISLHVQCFTHIARSVGSIKVFISLIFIVPWVGSRSPLTTLPIYHVVPLFIPRGGDRGGGGVCHHGVPRLLMAG